MTEDQNKRGNKTPRRVFLTGASGYIGKHVLLRLLEAGHQVTGSLRNPERAAEVRAALAPHLSDPGALARLSFATLDLERDTGWTKALEGAEVLVHTASPFPVAQPRDEDVLIRPAVKGTLRALSAARAAGVGRVVLTSSSAAIQVGARGLGRPVTEDDWSNLEDPAATAYAKSKTMAERAAWEFVRSHAPELALTVINPVFVVGPPLDLRFGSSVGVVRRLLSGKDPLVPRLGFALVDVRDVAEMHLRAIAMDDTIGLRFIAADRGMWFSEMAAVLRQAFPGRRIPRREAPNALMRVLGLFDPQIRAVLPSLGQLDTVSNARARAVMGMTFRDTAESLGETARFLIENKLV